MVEGTGSWWMECFGKVELTEGGWYWLVEVTVF